MVLAALAVELARFVSRHGEQVVDGLVGSIGLVSGGLSSAVGGGDAVECATVGAHHLGDIAAGHAGVGEQFEGAHHGVVLHGAALYDDVAAEVVVAAQLQYLVEAVAHDGVRQSGGDVLNGGALAQHLLYFRVHKHRAAGAEVAGLVGFASQPREVLNLITQSAGEGLDECTAARRAGLVELHAGDGAVVDEDGLHVLAADVEDEAHLRHQPCGGAVVGHRLDDALVKTERGLDEFLAVARRAGADDVERGPGVGGLGLETLQPLFGGMNGVAEVHRVVGEDNLPLTVAFGAHGDDLCGRRTGVDADGDIFVTGFHGVDGCGVLRFVIEPGLVVGIRGEERLQLVVFVGGR